MEKKIDWGLGGWVWLCFLNRQKRITVGHPPNHALLIVGHSNGVRALPFRVGIPSSDLEILAFSSSIKIDILVGIGSNSPPELADFA